MVGLVLGLVSGLVLVLSVCVCVCVCVCVYHSGPPGVGAGDDPRGPGGG